MKKGYLHKGFFIDNNEKDLLEMKSQGPITHKCITEEKEDLKVYNALIDSNFGTKIVVGLGDYIPLWQEGVTLNWKFNPIFDSVTNADKVKAYIRELLTDAILSWGDSAPIQFEESQDSIDFEIILERDDCNSNGCTLARAFLPNSDQNTLAVYPRMFTQNRSEQVDTLIHEIGHIFGLRHYFAKESEGRWRSEIFGDHKPLTIMNYGYNSTLTEQDRIDLKNLYSLVWNGQIDNINGLEILQISPYTKSLSIILLK